MSKKSTLAFETVDLIKKGLCLLLGARLKDKDSISSASKKIDSLREKYGDIEDWYDSVELSGSGERIVIKIWKKKIY